MMSLRLAELRKKSTKKNMSRDEILALEPEKAYDDGRTKQSFKDGTDIEKIMARFDRTGTISHLQKFEGVYADFSDFDFHQHSNDLARGEAIFAELPAELRQEFGQSPAAFFQYVNDPINREKQDRNLPALAEPGRQLPLPASPDADSEAALAAAATPVAKTSPIPVVTPPTPPDVSPDV